MKIWNDDKLKWNASKYGDISRFQVHKYEVWEPDILLLNGYITNDSWKQHEDLLP